MINNYVAVFRLSIDVSVVFFASSFPAGTVDLWLGGPLTAQRRLSTPRQRITSRPGGLNPSIIGAYASVGDPLGCIAQAQGMVAEPSGFNATREPPILQPLPGCVPFGDMDANDSNGSSIYHGLSVNLASASATHDQFLALLHVVAFHR